MPTFKNEIAPDLSQPPTQQQPQLEMDRENLEEKIEKFEERIEALSKVLTRSSESRLHNKVNELQEELCQKRFDLLVAQIHLSAVRSQLQLFEYNYRPTNFSQSTLSLLAQQHAASGKQQLSGGVGGSGAEQGIDLGNSSDPSGALISNSTLQERQGGAANPDGPGGSGSSGSVSRKTSSGLGNHYPTIGYRNKWIKAFKSLKETPAASPTQAGGALK